MSSPAFSVVNFAVGTILRAGQADIVEGLKLTDGKWVGKTGTKPAIFIRLIVRFGDGKAGVRAKQPRKS